MTYAILLQDMPITTIEADRITVHEDTQMVSFHRGDVNVYSFRLETLVYYRLVDEPEKEAE